MTAHGEGTSTLAVDCGGTGLKCLVLDAAGTPITDRARVRTPYPCPPSLFVSTLVDLAAATGASFDRVSVGMPGLVRHGVVLATPHYVTESGPFTPVREDLVPLWAGFDAQRELESAFGRPTRVANDAEIAGLAVIRRRGYEVMITLGTGMGFAAFDDGHLLPKIEMSHAPFRKKETYDQQLGNHARKEIGTRAWVKRVSRAIDSLRPVLWWDTLYVGGGGSKHLPPASLGTDVRIVANAAGMLGGIRLWED
jgi:polyphosphate glucokinase